MKGRLFIIVILLFLLSMQVNSDEGKGAVLYFFYSSTCPHCAAEKPFLEELEEMYPQLEVRYLEASKNADLFGKMAEDYNTSA
ncbi:MAG: thioredoxin family protein, partial [Candidatus Altiarchaeota archaeon]|nr:thioredoxin family protein [Candidatus Altiarchaeota archaeon]